MVIIMILSWTYYVKCIQYIVYRMYNMYMYKTFLHMYLKVTGLDWKGFGLIFSVSNRSIYLNLTVQHTLTYYCTYLSMVFLYLYYENINSIQCNFFFIRNIHYIAYNTSWKKILIFLNLCKIYIYIHFTCFSIVPIL